MAVQPPDPPFGDWIYGFAEAALGVIGTIMLGLVAAVRKGDFARFTKIEEDNKALWIATESNRSKADERHEYLLSTVATKTDISGLREDIRSALHQGNGRGR